MSTGALDDTLGFRGVSIARTFASNTSPALQLAQNRSGKAGWYEHWPGIDHTTWGAGHERYSVQRLCRIAGTCTSLSLPPTPFGDEVGADVFGQLVAFVPVALSVRWHLVVQCVCAALG